MKFKIVPVVSVALISEGGSILFAERPEGKDFAGLWETPGGKVEPGETLVDAAVREMMEECGVALDPHDLIPIGFAGVDLPTVETRAHISLYACRAWGGPVLSMEEQRFIWWPTHAIQRDWLSPGSTKLMPALLSYLTQTS
jgi:8-oxo-dGTP diphosphatase